MCNNVYIATKGNDRMNTREEFLAHFIAYHGDTKEGRRLAEKAVKDIFCEGEYWDMLRVLKMIKEED
jgi:hypothetical protein